MVNRGDRRRQLVRSVVTDAATLLVFGNVVSMNTWFDGLQLFVPLIHELTRQEILQHDKFILVEISFAERGNVLPRDFLGNDTINVQSCSHVL